MKYLFLTLMICCNSFAFANSDDTESLPSNENSNGVCTLTVTYKDRNGNVMTVTFTSPSGYSRGCALWAMGIENSIESKGNKIISSYSNYNSSLTLEP